MGRGERRRKVFEKTVEMPAQSARPGDQNIVGTFPTRKGKNGRGGGP